ncbi:MAG TPA: DMT family transporter [Rubellimicrobium sp.]|nr:DMT family transporter [Rubellimicrobium sp.]
MAGVLLICAAAGLWSTVGVASAFMSDAGGEAPALIGLVRTVLGAASLLLAASVLGLPRPRWRRMPLGLLAVFGVAGAAFQLCLFAAFREVGVTATVAVTVCAPVLIVAAAEALGQRRAHEWAVTIAMALGTAGVVLAIPRQGGGGTTLEGAALLAGASAAFAVLGVATRRLGRQLDPVHTAGLGLAASALVLGAVLGLEPGRLSAVAAPSGRDLAILLYIGVAATGAAYLAFVLGMQRCSSASAGLAATMVEPGTAALLAALMLHERLSPPELGGCALMTLAVILLARAERGLPVAPAAAEAA